MKIFDRLSNYYTKDGKGVKKRKITDDEKYGLAGFFKVYKDRFWQLLVLNLMYLLFIFPLLFALMGAMGVTHIESQTLTNVMYAPLYGAHLYSPNPGTAALMGIYGTQTALFTPNNTVLLVFYLISALTLFTFGMANTGMTYLVRGYTRGDGMFIWSDYFRAIKKNLVSSILMGFCDILLIIMLVFSSFYYYYNVADFMGTILFFMTFAMAVIYFMMRFYIYLLLITFKLSPIKLIKNALILAMLGIKRNVMATLGIIILVALNVLVFTFFPNIGMLLPFFLLMSNGSFMSCFAAYPMIKKYMIDPYYQDHPEEKEPEVIDEPIFLDYT